MLFYSFTSCSRDKLPRHRLAAVRGQNSSDKGRYDNNIFSLYYSTKFYYRSIKSVETIKLSDVENS